MIDEIVSHYKVIEKIGDGGMGVVYKARDIQLDRIVALKFLHFSLSANLTEEKRFLNEAKTLASLNHPNVATIYDIEESDEKSFIVMEFVEGQDLRHYLTNEGYDAGDNILPIDQILSLTIQIVKALQAAHNKQIIHRDIKPENIIINSEGHVKILDFGLAKMVGQELLTKIGITMGTAAYMSPEQTRGEPVDYRTDIWSVGVILYEMITGNRPFRGDYEQAIIYSILNENPESLKQYRPDIPDRLSGIVLKALAKNPVDRYQNCEELLKELQSCTLSLKQIHNTDNQKGVEEKISVGQYQPDIKPDRKTINIPLSISWKVVIAILILVGVCIYVFIPGLLSDKTYTKKIAVLPFINLSNYSDDEYFSDGMMEDILTQLVKIGDLKVISRTTMMTYKNSNKTVREISEELDADVVLEGSVRRDANELRIAVQLIDGHTDEHLWAETYNEELKKVFIIQSEIATRIGIELHVKLSEVEKDRLIPPATSNIEAYDLTLKGAYYLSRGSRDAVEEAIRLFRQVLSIDENNARAWAQLATAYARQADLGAVSTEEGYSQARLAAEKALALDDQLAQGHTIMGWIKRSYDWDWLGAEAECRKALDLAPGDINVIRNMANLEKSLGRFDHAIILMKKASELDPKKVTIYTSLGLLSMYANHLEEAAGAYQKAIELNPDYPPAHTYLGLVYILQGKYESAISQILREKDEGWRLYGLAQAYNATGHKAKADSVLKVLIEKYGSESTYQVAAVYAYRDDLENAFEWLEKAYTSRDGGLSEFIGDPFMKKLKKDKRYKNFLIKMNFPI